MLQWMNEMNDWMNEKKVLKHIVFMVKDKAIQSL